MSVQPSPKLEGLMEAFVETVRREFLPDDAILERATIRWEYRKRRKWRKDKARGGWWSDCQKCFHDGRHYCQGPYLYLYWKEKGKLRKKYLGKGPGEYLSKKVEKCHSHFARLVTKSLNSYMDAFMLMTGTVQNGKVTNKHQKRSFENDLWPEEEQALEDIKTGKTAMKKQTGKEFLKELETIVDE